MHRKKKDILGNIAIFSVSLLFAVVAIAVSSPISFQTTDDTPLLYKILSKQPSTQVQGASSESLCPEDKPIVGWIDFQGNKKIAENLPGSEVPSACFRSDNEAREEGFSY